MKYGAQFKNKAHAHILLGMYDIGLKKLTEGMYWIELWTARHMKEVGRHMLAGL